MNTKTIDSMNNLKYKGYTGTIENHPADKCLFGKVEGIVKDSITYEGQSITELKTDFENAIDSYLEGCEELGIKPS